MEEKYGIKYVLGVLPSWHSMAEYKPFSFSYTARELTTMVLCTENLQSYVYKHIQPYVHIHIHTYIFLYNI